MKEKVTALGLTKELPHQLEIIYKVIFLKDASKMSKDDRMAVVNELINFSQQVRKFIEESGEPKRDVLYNMYRLMAQHQEVLKDHDGAILSYIEIAETLKQDMKQS